MKFTAKRLLAAGAVGLATVITPLTLAVALPGVSTLPSSVAGAATGTPANPDEILYGQTTGSPSTFFRYCAAVMAPRRRPSRSARRGSAVLPA